MLAKLMIIVYHQNISYLVNFNCNLYLIFIFKEINLVFEEDIKSKVMDEIQIKFILIPFSRDKYLNR